MLINAKKKNAAGGKCAVWESDLSTEVKKVREHFRWSEDKCKGPEAEVFLAQLRNREKLIGVTGEELMSGAGGLGVVIKEVQKVTGARSGRFYGSPWGWLRRVLDRGLAWILMDRFGCCIQNGF